MSHHKHRYWIFVDEDEKFSESSWRNADSFLNGCAVFGDFKEAVAFAKRAAKMCNHNFEVVERPCGGIKPKENYYWTITK